MRVEDIVAADDDFQQKFWRDLEEYAEMNFAQQEANFLLFGNHRVKFDEVAVMVSTALEEYLLLENAARVGGWDYTFAAFDHVVTEPIPGHYDVHYSFLTREDKPWRIEVMRMLGGVSPLHNALSGPNLQTVHLSFKVEDVDAYSAVTESMRQVGMEQAQRCDSTYGRFSYWREMPTSLTPAGAFIKPRVNLRDAQKPAAATESTEAGQ